LAELVRTKCRNSAWRPIDGVDFNAKRTQCAPVPPMKNYISVVRLHDHMGHVVMFEATGISASNDTKFLSSKQLYSLI